MSDEIDKTENFDDWEYEYVELPNDKDLVDYNEYEYIEVSADSLASLPNGVEFEELDIEELDIEELDIEEIDIEEIDYRGFVDDVIEIPYDKNIVDDYSEVSFEYSVAPDALLDEKAINNTEISVEETFEDKIVPIFTNTISKPDFLLAKDVNVSWYCDNKDIFIKVSSTSFPSSIQATEKSSSILINVSPADVYGWNVVFANGLMMSIRDLQSYQCRNGAIPDASGTIYCGEKRASFQGIKRIVFYETPEYVSYNK